MCPPPGLPSLAALAALAFPNVHIGIPSVHVRGQPGLPSLAALATLAALAFPNLYIGIPFVYHIAGKCPLNTMQHSTVQQSTAQYSTEQHCTFKGEGRLKYNHTFYILWDGSVIET